jgi:hypothetical protein
VTIVSNALRRRFLVYASPRIQRRARNRRVEVAACAKDERVGVISIEAVVPRSVQGHVYVAAEEEVTAGF